MRSTPLYTALGLTFLTLLAACDDGSGAPCETSADCPNGEVCEDNACACPAEGCPEEGGRYGFGGDGDVTVASAGSLEVTSAGGAELRVSVPSGATSVAVVMDGAGSNLVLAEKITAPDGTVVFDYQQDVLTNRTDATDGLYTVLLPSNPDVELSSGEWTLSYLSGGSAFTGEITTVIRDGGSAKTLDLNLFFVGLADLNAETARQDPAFQQLLEGVEQAWASAGLKLGDVAWRDITGEDADRLSVIDSIDGPQSELAQLFKKSDGQVNRALNLFFVSDITAGDAGFSIVGLSGGVPGPPALHGTDRSGVAVNLADYLEARSSGDPGTLEEARKITEIIMAHETGHYLGLFHTTERNGQALSGINGQDPLSDTPVCPDTADANANGSLSAAECGDQDGGNLMFWSPLATSRNLSPQQGRILLGNPLVR